VGVEAKVYSENNYFEDDMDPTKFLDTSEHPGYIKDIGSYFVNSEAPELDPSGVNWSPSDYYSYTPDAAANVKSIVMEGAGVGKIFHQQADLTTWSSLKEQVLAKWKSMRKQSLIELKRSIRKQVVGNWWKTWKSAKKQEIAKWRSIREQMLEELRRKWNNGEV
ncbi:MAG: hypothetical protein L0H73_18785, partial [Nitrococcus sp.]|nr:hypothetical protein [Nitrococcus sp.]